jgi:hypothetical protein
VVNRDPQSVLTWDFDVLRHDIAFCVYRTAHELQPDEPDDAGTGKIICIKFVSALGVRSQKLSNVGRSSVG